MFDSDQNRHYLQVSILNSFHGLNALALSENLCKENKYYIANQ